VAVDNHDDKLTIHQNSTLIGRPADFATIYVSTIGCSHPNYHDHATRPKVELIHLVIAVMLPLPPANLRVWVDPFADAELFRNSGEETAHAMIELCGLKPDGRVLEIGCGCGRFAALAPLAFNARQPTGPLKSAM
jgi:hypothetical protein